MFEHFKDLSEKESSLVVNAIAYITILIAGADGNIDNKEKEWAAKVTKIRSYNLPIGLKDYYKLVGENYQNTLDELIDSLPNDVEERKSIIHNILSELNDILPKLNRNFSIQLVESYRSFAEHVAKASGGFIGIGSISSKEKELISLEMITYPETLEDA